MEEVITTRQAYLFASFGKTVLWSLFVTLALLLLTPAVQTQTGWSLSTVSLLGGFACGLGMTINGSCAFATLSRLGDGDAAMLVTLGALIAGATGTTALSERFSIPSPTLAPAVFDPSQTWAVLLLLFCGAWGAWEIVRLLRTRSAGASLLSGTYRLSTAALFIGGTNGFLFSLYGNWSYTTTLVRSAQGLTDGSPSLDWVYGVLFGALLFGMIVSSWLRHSFRLRLRPRASWWRNLIGGALMGIGAAMIPGGNDALLLNGIPNLSPHAVPAYLAMVVGIAAALACLQLGGQRMDKVDCSKDICRSA